MQPSTWDRLESIFFEALALQPDERAAFLDRECAHDPDLRTEVEAVLASHLAMAEDDPIEIPPENRVGSRIGAWHLESLIGRGGMGEVYRATRADEEYEQEVAIKIVRSGLAPFEMVRRFRLERQILARLEHRNVAALLDGGVTAEGQPYLVMQYVRGSPITEYVDAQRLPVHDRLRLFVTVCRAVQFAHSNLVVHRDLKPSNIMVTEDGQVRLLDFGIAKLLDPDGAGGPVPTESLLLLTPEHAAPEQFLGQPITTTTDVYQLGILLYQLLTGVRPFQGATPVDLHRAICEHEPTRPSAALGRTADSLPGDTVGEADTARARSTTPDGLRRQLRGDLDRIVLMALRKDPERRYGSAADLADDVERHLEGFPVRARPDGFGYVTSRFLRRHRIGFAASMALAASLVALLVLSLRFAATTSAQAAELQEERDVALEVSSFLEGLFEASDPYASGQVRRDTLPLRSFLDDGARRIREGLDSQPLVQARLLSVLGKAWRNLGRFQESRPLLEEALTIREREVGPDSPESAISRSELALLLDDLGEHDDAEELLRSSLEVFERDTVAFARSLATTWGVLGNVLQDNGNFGEAETAYRRAIELADRDSTTTDGRRAEQLSNLATVLSRQAHLDEAQSLLEQAVALARSYHGDTHPTTASMLNNLGSVLRSRNELDSAEVVLREALGIRRQRFESPNPAIAVSVNNVGELLLTRGDFAGAEPLFRESLEMRRALFGERHPSTGVGWLNLAALLQRLPGRGPEAVQMYGEARSILTAALGSSHPNISAIDDNLGRYYHDTDDHASALRHYRASSEVLRAAYDEKHPLVLGNMSDIGRCLADLGRYDEAESMLLESYAALEPQREQHARVFDSLLVRLGRLYQAMGNEAEAARYEAMRSSSD